MRKSWNGAKWIRRERRLAIYLRDGLSCAYCGSGLEDDGVTLSLDHVVPVSQGGNNRSNNLITSCRRCNTVRGDRSLFMFARAVSSYLNHGVESQDIINHVLTSLRKPVDLRAARRIVAKRASWQQALAEATDQNHKGEK